MAKRKQWRDPFADYIEWTQHRYDPGYYLGGRIPPHLKKSSLGPKGRRNAGILLTLSGIVGMGEVFLVCSGLGHSLHRSDLADTPACCWHRNAPGLVLSRRLKN